MKSSVNGTKILLSVGGQRSETLTWVNSIRSQDSRGRLLNSLFRLLKNYDFDGVNFDLQGLSEMNNEALEVTCQALQVSGKVT